MATYLISGFSRVQPVTLEMLDAKSSIMSSCTTALLAIIDNEIFELRTSEQKISHMKKKMGAFSSREQNLELRSLRDRHKELGSATKWLIDSISKFYSQFWPLGDTNGKMIEVLEISDEIRALFS